ncbi:MAG: nucleoside monophosphate kinase [Caldisericia bacterium]|nr:nucleoside monophosphate kinase [Caldisericia bacterium]
MIIVLIGPPGSGKSTQGHLIANKYGLPFIGVGDLVRDMIHSDNSEYKKKVNSGNLLPDDVVFGIVKAKLDQYDTDKGFILEGYPRTIGQAKLLDEYLLGKHCSLNCVLYMDNVVDQDIADRIKGRYQCSNCGSTYSKEKVPSNLMCARCGKLLVPRCDDTITSLKCRMQEYKKKSLPVYDYYTENKCVTAINASKSIEEVFEKAVQIIER